jgi:hypothetical protein
LSRATSAARAARAIVAEKATLAERATRAVVVNFIVNLFEEIRGESSNLFDCSTEKKKTMKLWCLIILVNIEPHVFIPLQTPHDADDSRISHVHSTKYTR